MNCLEWEDVSVRVGRAWALRGLSLAVERGEMLALMGAPGCGKSAALAVAQGHVPAASGRVWVDGRSAARAGSRLMGYPNRLPKGTVFRWLERGSACNAKAALHAWGLDAYRGHALSSLPDSVRVRVALAAQWARPASVWLLDDPTTLLEPEWQQALAGLLYGWVQREGGAVVMATHEPDVAAAAHRVAILHNGRVAAVDAPAALCSACAPEEVTVRTLDPDAAAAALYSSMRLEAERTRDGLRLRVRRADTALPGILQTIGGQVETIWVRRPTLRDAVRRFTGQD